VKNERRLLDFQGQCRRSRAPMESAAAQIAENPTRGGESGRQPVLPGAAIVGLALPRAKRPRTPRRNDLLGALH